MSTVITDHIRNLLSRSLPAIICRKAAIIEAMAASLAAADPDQSPGEAGTTALLLMNMLIEQVAYLAEGRQPQHVDLYRAEHRLYAIGESHYARFAEALIPVLRDVAGSSLPTFAASSWCDAFRAVVQRMQHQSPCLPFETVVSNPSSRNAVQS